MCRKNILIVDDDPNIIGVITSTLEKNLEYNILQSLSVDLAVSICDFHKIDLVISDWEMPVKNGLDLINHFRGNYLLVNIPIIIISGIRTQTSDLKRAFETGAIDFLRKPIDEIELIARVKSILKLSEYQEQIIAQKNKELALHAIYLLENEERQIQYFKSLKEIVIKLSSGKQGAINYIQNILLEKQGDLQRNAWTNFEFYFNQNYPDFTRRLSEKFPELTPAEIRLCTFIRMNMTSQAIADIIHNTVDSVKTSRTRLRTKLNLDRTTNLTTFISSI